MDSSIFLNNFLLIRMIDFTGRVISACIYLVTLNFDSCFTVLLSSGNSKWENKWQAPNCTQLQFPCKNVQNIEERFFQCDNGACINEDFKCDGVKQCCDGSDERTQTCNGSAIEIRRKRATGGHCAPPLPSLDKTITYDCDDAVNSQSCLINGLIREHTIAKIVCNPNHLTLNGTIEGSVCRKNKWWPPIDKCHKICDMLSPINVELKCYNSKYTQIDCSKNSLLAGARVQPTCKSLHVFKDNVPSYNELVCQEDGKWDKTLFACTPVCGRSFTSATPLISNGVVERFGGSPWHVAIYNKKKVLICGGTIIHPLLILSAAHCFYTNKENGSLESANDFDIVVSKFTRNYSATDNRYQQSFKIKEIRLSDTKGYFDLANYHTADIAILVLKEQLKIGPTVLPACIDVVHRRLYPSDGTMGKVVGWGKNEHDAYDEHLHTANLPFISRQRCFEIVPDDFKPYITFDKFCAGSEQGAGVLQGDSGGGILFREGDFYFIRGIVSIKQPTDTKIAAFTDLADHMDWIKAVRDEMDREIINRKSTPPSKSPTVPKNEPKPILPSNNFDWTIWRLLSSDTAGNFIVSPMLIKLIIIVLYFGTSGLAAKEMESVLGIDSTSKRTFEHQFFSIIKTLEENREANDLCTNIKLLVSASAQLNPSFSKKIKFLYNSTVGLVDFKNKQQTLNVIEAWCYETNYNFAEVVFQDDFEDDTVMMLLNVLSFRGEWKYSSYFIDGHFFITPRVDIYSRMIAWKNKFGYYDMKELKSYFIRIPYVGDKFAMYVLYPREFNGLTTLIKNITPEIISRSLIQKTENIINLSFPTFDFTSVIKLKETLEQLGMRKLFDKDVNWDNIGSHQKGPLKMFDVFQKCGIEVDIHSSSPSNVSSDYHISNETIEISITHPFMFLVVDENHHNILLMGKVTDPGEFSIDDLVR